MNSHTKMNLKQYGRSTPRRKPTTVEIEEIEKHAGAKLPDSYVLFLEYCNGGAPQARYFFAGDEEWSIDFFFYLAPTDVEDSPTGSVIFRFHNITQLSQTFSNDKLIPIGRDAFGNLICLYPSRSEEIPVVIWDHEIDELIYVADSFDDFLDLLSITSIYE